MKILGIIPARMKSERFPGKPLVEIGGKPMIEHVYERAQKSKQVAHWLIATPDEAIRDAALGFGAAVAMTSDQHESGTERCIEVIQGYPEYDVALNLQGDEPLIEAEQIDTLASQMGDADVATLYRVSTDTTDFDSPNLVKLVSNINDIALYFSRAPIPYDRDQKSSTHKIHVGMYAYTYKALQSISQMKATPLEKLEKLEQLRWLENGLSIKCIKTEHQNIGVDTPQDLIKIKELYK